MKYKGHNLGFWNGPKTSEHLSGFMLGILVEWNILCRGQWWNPLSPIMTSKRIKEHVMIWSMDCYWSVYASHWGTASGSHYKDPYCEGLSLEGCLLCAHTKGHRHGMLGTDR